MVQPDEPETSRSFTSLIILLVVLIILFLFFNNYAWKREGENQPPVPDSPPKTNVHNS